MELAAARWQANYAVRRHARETMRQLSQLDDRTLRDLGLYRSELLSAVLEFERVQTDPTLRIRR